jgi:hypothetical protein
MATTPLKALDISQSIRPRQSLKEPVAKLSFEAHPQSTKPGVQVFPPPAAGTFLERKRDSPLHDEKLLSRG